MPTASLELGGVTGCEGGRAAFLSAGDVAGSGRLPRLGWSGHVSSIVDTGADASRLMPLDAQRVRID